VPLSQPQAKKERLEDWTAVLSDASRHAEALALAFEDAGARTGDTGMALIRLGRFQVQRNQECRAPGSSQCCDGGRALPFERARYLCLAAMPGPRVARCSVQTHGEHRTST
jgi:hypothetical protein